MIAIQTSERNGRLVAALLVEDTDELMLVSTGGVLIRTKVNQIREMGRSTQGVSLISLDEGTTLAGIEKICEPEEGNGNGHDGGAGAADAPDVDTEGGEA
jgi:DNA gyrase subunit A